MKKLLTSLLLVITAMILAFSTIACETKPSSEVESESGGESIFESVYVPTPEPIVGAGENGEVNLGDVLDILSPVLNNDYVTVNFEMLTETDVNGDDIESSIKVTAYVKRTVRGYDIIASIVNNSKLGNADISTTNMSVYFVDGILALGDLSDPEEPMWNCMQIGSFNGLINQLNMQIASDPETYAAYMEVVPALEQLKTVIGDIDLVSQNLSFEIDFAEYVNQALQFLIANKDASLYKMFLEYAMGISYDDADSIKAFEDMLKSFVSDNPTVAVLVDRIVGLINSGIMEKARAEAEANGVEFDETAVFQIDLKLMLDGLQAEAGVSTQEIIDMLKAQDPSLENYLPDAREGETAYDYLRSMLNAITVNKLAQDLLGSEEATAETLIMAVIQLMIETTVGETVDMIAEEVAYMFGISHSEKLPEGEESESVEEVEPVSLLALLEGIQLNVQTAKFGVVFKTDNLARPTALGLALKGQVSSVNGDGQIVTAVAEESVKLNISYGRILIDFEIPEEVLALLPSQNA